MHIQVHIFTYFAHVQGKHSAVELGQKMANVEKNSINLQSTVP